MKKLSKFANVHNQWFAKAKTPLPQFEETEVEGIEVPEGVDLGVEDEEEQEEVVTMTSAEMAELRRKADSTETIVQGFDRLGEALNKKPEVATPVQQVGETDEAFKVRFNEDLFKDDPKAVMDEYFNRMSGGIIQTLSAQNMQQAKKIMQLDPEKKDYYKKYKGEIEEKIKSLPTNQQSLPAALEYAYEETLKSHQAEIVQEQVEAQVQDAVAKQVKETLEGLGIEVPENGEVVLPGKPGVKDFTHAGGITRKTEKKTKKYTPTDEDVRKADTMGIAVEKYVKHVKFKQGVK